MISKCRAIIVLLGEDRPTLIEANATGMPKHEMARPLLKLARAIKRHEATTHLVHQLLKRKTLAPGLGDGVRAVPWTKNSTDNLRS